MDNENIHKRIADLLKAINCVAEELENSKEHCTHTTKQYIRSFSRDISAIKTILSNHLFGDLNTTLQDEYFLQMEKVGEVHQSLYSLLPTETKLITSHQTIGQLRRKQQRRLFRKIYRTR